MNKERTPHPHAEVIKAWADGCDIQLLSECGIWFEVANPSFSCDEQYRIKPEPVVVKAYQTCAVNSDGEAVEGARYKCITDIKNRSGLWGNYTSCVITCTTVTDGVITDVSIVDRKTPLIKSYMG